MASGADLLRRLQAQRRQTIAVPPSTSTVDDTANTIPLDGDNTTSTDESNYSPTLAAEDGDKPSLSVISVIVCTGSNCGSTRTTSRRDNLTSDGSSHVYGVSPTLLEIEELVQELKFEMATTTASSTAAAAASQPCLDGTSMCKTASNAKCGLQRLHANNDWRSATSNAPTIRVTSGGCVGHCSMGPTVSVIVDSSASLDTSTGQKLPLPVLPTTQTSNHTWKVRYYHQVNSSSACAQVVQEVSQLASQRAATTMDALQQGESRSQSHVDAIPSKSLSTSSFLMRRADGLRWKLLKEMSRYLARSSHTSTGTKPLDTTTTELNPQSDALTLLLDEVIKAEQMAAGSDASRTNRAKRRQARLSLLLTRNQG